MADAGRTAGSVSGRRILVTGGTGFIGSALCRSLVKRGDSVTVATRPGSDRTRLAGIADSITIVEADLVDFGQAAALVSRTRPEIVFHLACSVFNPPGVTASGHLDANIGATAALLEAVREHPACRLIHTGSAAEYPPGTGLSEEMKPAPVNVYGAMKACASLLVDAYARIYGLKTARAVLFTVYGPGEAPHRLVPSTIEAALRGQAVRLRDGAVQRDMLFIDDAVDGLLRMGDTDLAPGTALNLCSGTGLTVRHIAEEILRLMDAPFAIEEHKQDGRSDEIRVVSGDNSRARHLLDWRPHWSLEAGLGESIAALRAPGTFPAIPTQEIIR